MVEWKFEEYRYTDVRKLSDRGWQNANRLDQKPMAGGWNTSVSKGDTVFLNGKSPWESCS